MPWVRIDMMKGHTAAQKKELHERVAQAVAESLSLQPDWVKIQLVEMTEEDHSIGGVQINRLS